MTDREAAQATLAEMVGSDGVRGACILGRDGLPVLEEWPQPADTETVAAMGAALMGAAETALAEFGRHEAESVLVAAHDMRIMVVGIDEELVLLVAADRSLPLEDLEPVVGQTLESLKQVLVGA